MKKANILLLFALAGLLIVVTSCSKEKESLYKRLGERAAITLVVDTFITYVAAEDTLLNEFVAAGTLNPGPNNDFPALTALKKNLVDQIETATGGPNTYTGLSMSAAHAGMGITDFQFDKLVEALGKALTAYSVPATEQQELVDILAPLRSEIVGL